MYTHIDFQNHIVISGPHSESETIKDVADCVKDFGQFEIRFSYTKNKIFAYCTPTKQYDYDYTAMILREAIHTVERSDF